MQEMFLVSVSPKEYVRQGKAFPFPVPVRCPNPQCQVGCPLEKHGFYERYLIDASYCGREERKSGTQRHYKWQKRKSVDSAKNPVV